MHVFDYASITDPELSPKALLEQQQTKLNFAQYKQEDMVPLPRGDFREQNNVTMRKLLNPA